MVLRPIYAPKNFLENLLNFIFLPVWNRSSLLSWNQFPNLGVNKHSSCATEENLCRIEHSRAVKKSLLWVLGKCILWYYCTIVIILIAFYSKLTFTNFNKSFSSSNNVQNSFGLNFLIFCKIIVLLVTGFLFCTNVVSRLIKDWKV